MAKRCKKWQIQRKGHKSNKILRHSGLTQNILVIQQMNDKKNSCNTVFVVGWGRLHIAG